MSWIEKLNYCLQIGLRAFWIIRLSGLARSNTGEYSVPSGNMDLPFAVCAPQFCRADIFGQWLLSFALRLSEAPLDSRGSQRKILGPGLEHVSTSDTSAGPWSFGKLPATTAVSLPDFVLQNYGQHLPHGPSFSDLPQ